METDAKTIVARAAARHVRTAEAIYEHLTANPDVVANRAECVRQIAEVIARQTSPIGVPGLARQIDLGTRVETGEGRVRSRHELTTGNAPL